MKKLNCILLISAFFLFVSNIYAQPAIPSWQKITDNQGGIPDIDHFMWDEFGQAVAGMGDIDGDGIDDIAVGMAMSGPIPANGHVWILFMNANGSVRSWQDISSGMAGLPLLDTTNLFGESLTNMGDLDGNGVNDLAVGELPFEYWMPDTTGKVWILYLDSAANVIQYDQIGLHSHGLDTLISQKDGFGAAVARWGDYDKNGYDEIVIGANNTYEDGERKGVAYICYLDSGSAVIDIRKLGDSTTALGAAIPDFSFFGGAIANIGDLDDDGVDDLAIGTSARHNQLHYYHFEGGLYVLLMNSDGTIKSYNYITENQGGFSASFQGLYSFGYAVAAVGDLDNDGVTELVVGQHHSHENSPINDDLGAVWILFMNSDGTVKWQYKIVPGTSDFNAVMTRGAHVGSALWPLGDTDNDGNPELIIGASGDGDYPNHTQVYQGGAIYVASLRTWNTTHVPNSSGESYIDVFPNPVSDELNIAGLLTKPGTIHMAIIDLSGRLIFEKEVYANDLMQQKFDVGSLSSGMYVLRVMKDQRIVFSGKLIKE